MSNSPPSPGPDLFFAGGECLTRFGVWVRRTDMDLEAATREVATRNSVAEAFGRDGILRTWEADTPRAEWLNEVDLDPTRNLLETTDFVQWPNKLAGLEVVRLATDWYEVTDPGTDGSELNAGTQTGGDDELTYSVLLRKKKGAPTANVRFVHGVIGGCVVNPETGAFISEGTVNALAVEDEGTHWRVSVTIDAAGSFNGVILPAWGEPGTLSSVQDPAATGSNQFRLPQVENGATPTASQETPRDDDRKFPSLLLEDARTNGWTNSEALQVDWTTTRASFITDIGTAPDGSATPDRLFEDATAANTHEMSRASPTFGVNQSQSVSGFVKAAGRSVIVVRMQNGAATDVSECRFDMDAFTAVVTQSGGASGSRAQFRRLPNGWFYWSLTGTINSADSSSIVVVLLDDGSGTVYNGDGSSGADLWGLGFEVNAANASSYIQTAGATATRQRDAFSGAYTAPPQAATYYLRFIESGGRFTENARLFAITDDGGGTPQLRTTAIGGGAFYSSTLTMSAGSVSSGVSNQNPNIGDLAEALILIFEDGSIQQIIAINGGDGRDAPRSGPLEFDPAFSGQLLHLNSQGNASNFGFNRFLAVKAQRGVRTLAFMRAL